MKTLTEQDRATSLSKGKRKHKRVERPPKILLCNPFSRYWPQINEEDARLVDSILSMLLVKERRKPKIPWKKLVHLPRETRQQRIKEIYSREAVPEQLRKQRKYLRIGLNTVARGIQNGRISSCLLAGDSSPDFLISHLVTMAGIRGIPILIVPSLKDSISKILGFSATALGITVDEDSKHFESLHELIKKLCCQFPVPFHFAQIRKKTDIEDKTVVRPSVNVIPNSMGNQRDESSSSTMICDFSIDVTPGPTVESVVYKTKSSKAVKGDVEFIPLNSDENKKQMERSSNQLYEDYMSNLLYIAPKCARMQKNCNRQSTKKLLQL